MRSLLRRTAVIILLASFLAPGLLPARTSAWLWSGEGGAAQGSGFFKVAWSLLTDLWESWAPVVDGAQKTGPHADPSGGGTNGATTTGDEEGDSGGTADPSGQP